MAKVRQRLGKNYIHSNDHRIQSVIIDALAAAGFEVDIEITDNGHNEVVSCEIFDVGGGRKMLKNNRSATMAYKKTQEIHEGETTRLCCLWQSRRPRGRRSRMVQDKEKDRLFHT